MSPASENARDESDLRVAVVLAGLPGMSETFLRRHVEGLRADVVAQYRDGDPLDTASVAAEVRCLDPGQRPRRTLVRRILSRAREATLGHPAPRWSPRMHAFWRMYVRDRRPDVVLAEFGPNAICAMDACQSANLPLVAHFHGYDASALLRFPSHRRALARLFQQAAAIVVVSRAMERTLVDLGCPREKLNHIIYGTRLDQFFPGPIVSEQPCRFLAASSLTPKKGVLQTLRAFETCARSVEDVHLTFIGDGPLRRRAEAFVRKNGLSRQVTFLGWRSHQDVRGAMAQAGVFVQHSLTAPRTGSTEGTPVVIIEAAACGLPVISTRHAGIPEAVLEGVSGLLVGEGDWLGMAAHMQRLAENPVLRATLGAEARAQAEAVADAGVQIRLLRECLLRACATNRDG